ncbi:DUF6129 family protein [Breoghania sp.]|uniref:DUF6129 family protein n=1 Tax=Breoghania sp. TaxID=2065378 RepID=UPI002614FAC4|nr:DUF6129 family protein [Breoghania sp.]MDJ0931306.1 DUF6129 family protein [Breoghania sp.]
MAVTIEELAEIGRQLADAEASDPVFAALRQCFPHLTWTRCDTADIFEDPFETVGGYDLHLLDASDHCIQITADLDRATGIVLAARSATA